MSLHPGSGWWGFACLCCLFAAGQCSWPWAAAAKDDLWRCCVECSSDGLEHRLLRFARIETAWEGYESACDVPVNGRLQPLQQECNALCMETKTLQNSSTTTPF